MGPRAGYSACPKWPDMHKTQTRCNATSSHPRPSEEERWGGPRPPFNSPPHTPKQGDSMLTTGWGKSPSCGRVLQGQPGRVPAAVPKHGAAAEGDPGGTRQPCLWDGSDLSRWPALATPFPPIPQTALSTLWPPSVLPVPPVLQRTSWPLLHPHCPRPPIPPPLDGTNSRQHQAG